MDWKIKEFIKGMREGESYLHCALNVANIEGVIDDDKKIELHKFVKRVIKIAMQVKVEELRNELIIPIDKYIKNIEKTIHEEYRKEQDKIRKEIEEAKLNSPYNYEYKYDVDKGTLFDE